ncbi:hypothetical protein CDD83_8458 [Cordyceps sp. RAO-2017]|nr:hypothetical protein CDD83_8458 [Cordyceps sp. RAO-2017]
MASPQEAGRPDLARLPSCALGCLTASCPISDLTCICRAGFHGVEEQRSRCIIHSCGFQSSLYIRNQTATACLAPVRDQAVYFNAMTAAVVSATGVAVAVRLGFKQFFGAGRRRLGVDDWFAALATLVGVPCIAILVFGLNRHGLGRDIWALDDARDAAAFALYFYVMEILYLTVIALVRLTFTLFYLDIFPGRTTRRLLWATVAFHVVVAVAFVAKVVFQCAPVSYSWTKFLDGPRPAGRCIHINPSSWANAALGVAADLWLLAIPLTQLRRLQLHWKKKVGAGLMFAAGAIGTIVSILRLRSIVNFANSTNPTWEQYDIVVWSSIEVQVGLTCSCLPTIRLVLVRLWPRIFGVGSQIRSRSNGSQPVEARPGGSRQRAEPDTMGEPSPSPPARVYYSKPDPAEVPAAPGPGPPPPLRDDGCDDGLVELWSRQRQQMADNRRHGRIFELAPHAI